MTLLNALRCLSARIRQATVGIVTSKISASPMVNFSRITADTIYLVSLAPNQVHQIFSVTIQILGRPPSLRMYFRHNSRSSTTISLTFVNLQFHEYYFVLIGVLYSFLLSPFKLVLIWPAHLMDTERSSAQHSVYNSLIDIVECLSLPCRPVTRWLECLQIFILVYYSAFERLQLWDPPIQAVWLCLKLFTAF